MADPRDPKSTIFPPLKASEDVADHKTPNLPNPATPAETDTPAKRREAAEVAERLNEEERSKDPIAFVRRLWAGGEHRRAAEEVVLAKFSQKVFDDLAAEMPDLRELVGKIDEKDLREKKKNPA